MEQIWDEFINIPDGRHFVIIDSDAKLIIYNDYFGRLKHLFKATWIFA